MFLKNLKLFLVVIPVLCLLGCASYKAKPLYKVPTHMNKEQKSISMGYKVFTYDDCKNYLDRDVLSKGYQPIYFTFTNNTDRFLNISMDNSNLATVPYSVVADDVHTSTVKRAAWYGVASLFIFPFIIPAVVDSFCSMEANQKLDKDFFGKSFRNETVCPYSSTSGLVFVPTASFSGNIEVIVRDSQTNEQFTLSSASSTIVIKNIK